MAYICKRYTYNLPNMPTILRYLGFRFFFYSDEGTEPPHVHVEKGDSRGKIWLEPFEEDNLEQFKAKERRRALDIAEEHQQAFKDKWYEYFGN